MNERTRALHNAIHAIHIYSGLPKKEIVRQIRAVHGTRKYPYPSLFMTAARWGDLEYEVPSHHAEICQLGRRLTYAEDQFFMMKSRGELDVEIRDGRVYATPKEAPAPQL